MDERGNWSEVSADDLVQQKSQEMAIASKAMCFLSIGQIVEIEGEKFRVRKVTKKDVVLRSVRSR